MELIRLNNSNVKLLGRTAIIDDVLWCGLSATGAAFRFKGKKLSVVFVGDSSVSSPSDRARVAVYINGDRFADLMMDAFEKSVEILNSETVVSADIRIIKLSECAMSTVGIAGVCADSESVISPLPAKAHRIEFVGDSITCGYAIDDEDLSHTFSTSTEDATKTYAYKTAQALDADCNFVSFSGYGIISGYTATGDKVPQQLVPKYYSACGFSYQSFADKINPADVKWDHSRFVPDVVVINLGTNDDSYCLDYADRQKEFSVAYCAFLKQVRQANPDAHILCCVGIMGQRIFSAVKSGKELYCSETDDEKVSLLEFTEQLESDGRTVDYHPTVRTNDKAAELLISKIKEIMNW